MPSWSTYCSADAAFLAGVQEEYARLGTPVNVGPDGSVEKGADGSARSAVEYFQRDRSMSFDPLYQEPTSDAVWRGPYRLHCTLEFEDAAGHYDQDADESGVERTHDAIMGVSVSDWNTVVVLAADAAFDSPAEGDVVTVFNGDRSYSVEKVERSGYVGSSSVHTGWKLTLKSRSSFMADRLLPPKIRPTGDR